MLNQDNVDQQRRMILALINTLRSYATYPPTEGEKISKKSHALVTQYFQQSKMPPPQTAAAAAVWVHQQIVRNPSYFTPTQIKSSRETLKHWAAEEIQVVREKSKN